MVSRSRSRPRTLPNLARVAGAGLVLAHVLALIAGMGGAACSSASSASATTDSPDGGGDATFAADGGGNGDDAAVSPSDASGKPLDAGPFNGLQCTGSPCVASLAVGGSHVCALLGDGTVRCWGQNASGELGSGGIDAGRVDPGKTPMPSAVRDVKGATRVSAGGYGNGFGISCALVGSSGSTTSLVDGGVLCWGSNASGLLGLGAARDGGAAPTQSLAPLPLALPAVEQVALGGFFGCALMAGGSVSCWGDNAAGELGRTLEAGAFDPTPAAVPLPGPATAVASGKNHACALLADRSVVCWGAADHGAIGAVFDGGITTPQAIPGLTATQLAAGEVSTCAITAAGAVACWGGNQGGQLGRGDAGAAIIDPVPQPVALPAGLTALQIASAVSSTCALLSDRSAWCWGDNAYGELGTGSAVPGFSPVPTPALGLSNIVQIAAGAGGWTVCALLDNGSVRCWGANFADQLGVDTTDDSGADESPHPVPLRVMF